MLVGKVEVEKINSSAKRALAEARFGKPKKDAELSRRSDAVR